MSHREDQPLEVPWREVQHDEPYEELEGFDYIIGIGHARTDLFWPTPSNSAMEKLARELREQEQRRARLPFGFCLERAHAA